MTNIPLVWVSHSGCIPKIRKPLEKWVLEEKWAFWRHVSLINYTTKYNSLKKKYMQTNLIYLLQDNVKKIKEKKNSWYNGKK